ncbi:hypothetical protein MTO96_022897 [Rhipicephalus appendiculatus]
MLACRLQWRAYSAACHRWAMMDDVGGASRTHSPTRPRRRFSATYVFWASTDLVTWRTPKWTSWFGFHEVTQLILRPVGVSGQATGCDIICQESSGW